MLNAQNLADALGQSPASDFVRLVADWLHRVSRDPAVDLGTAPRLTGDVIVDALVAAAAAHACFSHGGAVPSWTTEPHRRTETLWYPGPDALLPNALVHTPLSFSVRGVLIEADSLESV
jgi:hypothetical protein